MTNCHNYSGKIGKFGKVVTLHKLPKQGSIRGAWIRAISRKNWKPTSYTRVCSDHFVNGVGPEYSNRLKVPSENLEQKKQHAAMEADPGDSADLCAESEAQNHVQALHFNHP